MPISIREAKASQQDRDWIEQAYGEYLADLAADQTGVFPSLTVTGQSIAEIVQGWFRDERSVPFVVAARKPARGICTGAARGCTHDDRKRHYRLSEFFRRTAVSQPRCRPWRGDAAVLALRGRMDHRRAGKESRRDPLLAPRRCRVHEWRLSRAPRPWRSRAPVLDAPRSDGARALISFPDRDLYPRRPRPRTPARARISVPATSGFLESHQHHVQATRRELDTSRRARRAAPRLRACARCRPGSPCGAPRARRDRCLQLQQAVGFGAAILDAEIDDAHAGARRRRARPGGCDGQTRPPCAPADSSSASGRTEPARIRCPFMPLSSRAPARASGSGP